MRDKFKKVGVAENSHDMAHQMAQVRAKFNPKRSGMVLAKRFGKVEMAKKLPKKWDGKANTAKAWASHLTDEKMKPHVDIEMEDKKYEKKRKFDGGLPREFKR